MGYGGPNGVGHEFAEPPPDDRDAIICILVSLAFLGFVVVKLIHDLFF